MEELQYYEDRSLAKCPECRDYHNIKWVKRRVCQSAWQKAEERFTSYVRVLPVLRVFLGIILGAFLLTTMIGGTIGWFFSSSNSGILSGILLGIMGFSVVYALTLVTQNPIPQWIDTVVERARAGARQQAIEKMEVNEPDTATLYKRGKQIDALPNESDE